MPSNWLFIDTNFPTFTGEESPDEKITTIQNYLFMLIEQLRYTLHNLDTSNMNGTALAQYGTSLTEPIYARIEDEEGNLAQLALTAQGLALQISDAEGNIGALQLTATALTSRISDAEGNISTLQQTASSLYSQISNAQGDISTLYQTAASLGSRISDAEGNISTLQQTATSLTSRISDAEGNISTLQQTASSLTSLISDAQGDISALQQTASSLTSRIGNAEGDISTLTQTVNGFGLSASNGTSSSKLYLTSDGVAVSSAVISFTGVVTFTDLSTEGATVIHGANLLTGTVTASTLQGESVGILNAAGKTVAIMQIEATTNTGLTINSSYALRLLSAGNLYLEGSDTFILMSGYGISVSCTWFYPTGTAAYLGYSGKGMWEAVYAYSGTIQTSDRNLKHDIEDLPDKYLYMLLALKPRRYKMNNGTSDRYHVGYIAQEVEEAMTKFGIDSLEFAGFVKDIDQDGNEIYMLRYEEFDAIHTLAIQRIYQRLELAGL